MYAATAVAGELMVDDEGLEAHAFEPEEIPWNDLAFRSTRRSYATTCSGLRDRDFFREIHVLNRVEQRHAFGHRAPKRLAARNQTIPPARLLAGDLAPTGPSTVSPADAPPELISPARPSAAVRKLIACEIDRIVR